MRKKERDIHPLLKAQRKDGRNTITAIDCDSRLYKTVMYNENKLSTRTQMYTEVSFLGNERIKSS